MNDWEATMNLRFVIRREYKEGVTQSVAVRILQQLWHRTETTAYGAIISHEIEWRDVPEVSDAALGPKG